MALVAGSPVRAHDPYESFTSVVLGRETLELTLTMARSTALQLVDPEKSIRSLTAENFSGHRARFERVGATLMVVTSGRATELQPRKSSAELTEENDVVFKLVFPRPPPGRLHFHSAFLRRLGPGYGGIIEVSDDKAHHLGWEQTSLENPNLEIVVPAIAK